jgi:hypothetical protein
MSIHASGEPRIQLAPCYLGSDVQSDQRPESHPSRHEGECFARNALTGVRDVSLPLRAKSNTLVPTQHRRPRLVSPPRPGIEGDGSWRGNRPARSRAENGPRVRARLKRRARRIADKSRRERGRNNRDRRAWKPRLGSSVHARWQFRARDNRQAFDEPSRSDAPTSSPWHQFLDLRHDHLSPTGRPANRRPSTDPGALVDVSPQTASDCQPQQKHTPRT